MAAKLGSDESSLTVGKSIDLKAELGRISGRFAAGGAAYESEIWCRLSDFQTVSKRQDISLVALLTIAQ